MKPLRLTHSCAVLLVLGSPALCRAQSTSDGFDYPVGIPFATAENDGDGYYNAQDFLENRHLGEDWNGEGGGNTDWRDPVYAVSNGTIVSAQNEGEEWGNVVLIEHLLPDGTKVTSMYAHLDEILVFSGEVFRGEQIGTIGRGFHYGDETYDYAAHLHFELRADTSIRLGPGYSFDATGWTEPSDFIDTHRVLGSPPSTGTLRGTVLFLDEVSPPPPEPVPDVTISLFDANTFELVAQTQSDAVGFYELAVPARTYFVEAFKQLGPETFLVGDDVVVVTAGDTATLDILLQLIAPQ